MTTLHVDGRALQVKEGVTVAAALLNAGITSFRRSVADSRRAPLCGMGTCFECRVTIDGQPHRRACMELARDGMSIDTDD